MKHVPLIAILLVGLALRIGGIGHGLAFGDISHPDTPKQVRALEQFLHGKQFLHIGLSDYDGYPLFASYLTSLLVRAGGVFVQPLMSLLGVTPHDGVPDVLNLYWMMRLMNALLATLAIFVVWKLGRENFCNGAGLLAAVFLALSPADVASCHYASGDTAAAVFGLVSIFFAMRIHRRGAWQDYALSGFFAALAFASKYHALVVCAAPGVAHFIRRENLWRWHRPDGVLRLAVLGAAFVGGLFFAIPGLRVEPVLMVKDILHFMGYAADFGLPPELAGAGFGAKLAFALKRNLPILAGLFSVPVVLALAVSLARVHRDARVALLLAAPVLYFVMGVSQRPMAHPVYHTIMTASVFVLAAAALVRLWTWPGRLHVPLRCTATGLSLAAVTLLGHDAAAEVFFFRRDDTRSFARAWAAENIPPGYAFFPSRYSFMSAVHVGTKKKHEGSFLFSPHIRPAEKTTGYDRWFEFGLEADALPFFRNPVLTAWLGKESDLRADGMMPVFQRQPSDATHDYIFTGLPEFFRSGRILNVPARSGRMRVIVSKEPLRDVLVCAAADSAAVRLDVRLGGVKKILRLKPYESVSVLVESPRRRLPLGTGYFLYDFETSAQHGGARVSVAFSQRERAVDLFQQGSFAEALPWLERALAAEKSPTLAAMRTVAKQGGGNSSATQPLPDWTADGGTLFPVYGVSENYLRGLPYLHWDARHLTQKGFTQVELPTLAEAVDTEIRLWGKANSLSAEDLWLEPGCYSTALHARALEDEAVTGTVSFVLSDGRDTFTNSAAMHLPADGTFTSVVARATIHRLFRSGSVQIVLPQGASLAVDALDIRPEPAATLRQLFAGDAARD